MQSQPTAVSRAKTLPKPVRTAKPLLQTLKSQFFVVLSIWRERRALRTASDEVLSDIGVDRLAAIEESRRMFYDLPADRLK